MANLQAGNKQNVVTGKDVRTRSKFKLDYHMFDTFRFGELHPHFVMECVPGDKNVSVRSEHNLRTYSLSAPLMQKISMKKDYFAVPMEAILPFNWDKIYTNPVQGDDVPDDAGTYVQDFSSLVLSFLQDNVPDLASDAGNGKTLAEVSAHFEKGFRWLLTAELFYSCGNLMSALGIHMSHLVKFRLTVHNGSYPNQSFDQVFDLFVNEFIFTLNRGQGYNSGLSLVVKDDNGEDIVRVPYNSAISVRRAIEAMRDNLGTFQFSIVADGGADISNLAIYDNSIVMSSIGSAYPFGLNLARLFAYQIVCAHYYTDDHVDYIYSAELYRQYIKSIIFEIGVEAGHDYYGDFTFDYNGSRIEYDYLSAHDFTFLISENDYPLFLSYLQAIFGYKHSLRYKDYFVGSRTQPLAVGDVNVAVSDNNVSVVDVTQKTQLQRFLNSVNRSGRKFSNYVGNLFGVHVAPDYHDPFFLGHTSDDIYGQEVENTNVENAESGVSGNAGQNITEILRSNASRYAFEFDADRPCIIIGITYFDIPRSYWESIERQNFHKDRFDMFNPYMQFIGDQKVYLREISPARHDAQGVDTFGYQLRHAEYKQRYNQAAGGFVQNLPGFAFLNDYGFTTRQTPGVLHIGPAFIRSNNTELDRYYLSLTGFSLGSYFHFIVDNYNDVSASRPMVYAPSIL